uniref:peptidylprolyl isomerase n=1 Tax=Oryza punctata TaxID=4537 RepID=A0A0E0JK69_ORYPU
MKLSELGKPDDHFYVWREGVGRLERVESELGRDHGSPGFAKWTVQKAAGKWWYSWVEEEGFYCNEVQVHFTGKRLDGTLFTSTREDDLPLTFILGQENVMQGFSMAISSMKAGEKAVFTIPAELAGTISECPAGIPGNIPPNQALWFDIELISLVTIIDILDDEGILKKTIKHGMGNDKPRHLDEVLVNYNACLEDGVSVSMSEGVEFSLAEDGFGERGRPSLGNEASVPPDATLYVYLQLMSWKTVSHIGKNRTILKKTINRGNLDGQHPHNQAVVREQVSDVLEDAVRTMREGEIALFTIPPHLVQEQLMGVPPDSSVTYEIELVSVVNEKQPFLMSRAESVEAAAEKEKEGDTLFSSHKYLRAYRRYYKVLDFDPRNVKARQMVGQEFPEAPLGIDPTALHRGLEENIYDGLEQMKVSMIRQKQGNKYHGRNIYVPPIPRPETSARQALPAAPTGQNPATPTPTQNAATTTSGSHASVAGRKGLSSCFGCIS